jgi:hypothetical protein
MVPDCFTTQIECGRYNLIEDRGNWDYILDNEAFSRLEGKRYRRQREIFNKLERSYPQQIKLIEYNISKLRCQLELMRFYKQWASNITFDNDKRGVEAYSIQKRFGYSSKIRLGCLVLYLANKIEGFLIYSLPPQKDYAIANHLKCNYEIDGLFDFIMYGLAKKLYLNGIRYLNIEQDLDKTGLRKHKGLLRPQRFLKKYKVSLKED